LADLKMENFSFFFKDTW